MSSLTIAILCSIGLPAQQGLRTYCEESGFTEYTPYESQAEYLLALQGTTTEMKTGVYGETWLGREMPYLVYSRPTVTQPWEAMALGKPIILFQGNVHGGERTLRESLLILSRELATPGTQANGWLDDLTIVIVPQVNPDGFGDGQRSSRGNSRGIDLNRDYMKLEHPEIASLVQLYAQWRPHLIIDGHNGGARPYNINYITSGNAAPDQTLIDMCNMEIFPLVGQRIEENDMKAFYYPGGNEEFWQGAPTYPRIGMSYACLANALGITFESPGQPIDVGVPAGVISFKAVLEYCATNAAKVLGTVDAARRKTIALGEKGEGDVMVAMEVTDQDYTVSYEIRDGEGYRTIENGKLRTKPVITKTRPRPYAYILPREAQETVALLRRHNITVEILQEAIELEVQAYVAGAIDFVREYDHNAAVTVEVSEVVTLTQTFPKQSYVVPTGQMMGRVVTYLLEPETDDNVIRWNTMDSLLPQTRIGGTVTEAAAGGRRGGQGAQRGGGRRGQGRRGQRAQGQRGQRGQGRRGGRGGQRGGRGGFRGGRGGGRETRAILPIYKLMAPTPLPTKMVR